VSAGTQGEVLLQARGLGKSYVQERAFTREKFHLRAFEGIDLSVRRGTTFAIVGESGAGKSSLARCLALLEAPECGEIRIEGRDVARASRSELFALRRNVQLIFQDATAALNERFTAAEIVAEPMRIQGLFTPAERRERALEQMEKVGLARSDERKRVREFSGGQRQRLAIARSLSLEPNLLILDEALANLDLANQELILRLLGELQDQRGLTYIHISHNLLLVSQIADEVALLHEGRIVEQGRAADFFAHPRTSYSNELIRALPPLETILRKRLQEEPA
jgi:ABC-type glutathione transport system ATPase component